MRRCCLVCPRYECSSFCNALKSRGNVQYAPSSLSEDKMRRVRSTESHHRAHPKQYYKAY